MPKARARHYADNRGGGFYNPAKTTDAELVIQGWFLASVSVRPNLDSKSQFKVKCWFYTKGRQRVDIDNLLKLCLDSLSGIVWADDSQVWDIEAHRRIDQENPRTEVTITTLT